MEESGDERARGREGEEEREKRRARRKRECAKSCRAVVQGCCCSRSLLFLGVVG